MVRELIEDGETEDNKENYRMEIHNFETKRTIQNEVGRGCKACFRRCGNLSLEKES